MLSPRHLTLCCFALLLASCSKNPTGRVDIWGAVTYKGQPVPAGVIIINPDLSKGNDGPQGMAEIKDGRYDTRSLDKGAPSGAAILMIDGFDGVPQGDQTLGKALFVGYKLSLDIPNEPTEKNIEVPETAGKSNKSYGAVP